MTQIQSSRGVPLELSEREKAQRLASDYVAAHGLVPPLSMEELRDHAEKIAVRTEAVDYIMVLLNNAIWRETVASIPYDRRLLLLPQCLRDFKECLAEMDEFGLLCEECGCCSIGELQALAEDLGYVVLVAEGSTVVSRLLEGGKVDAVVGVSCLNALEKSFPHMADSAIPGLAIPLTVDGCIGTRVDIGHVYDAIRLKSSNPWTNTLDMKQLRKIVDDWFSVPIRGETETERIASEWLFMDGKRWRPFLLACTYSALKDGTTELSDEVRRLALAVECFHKASLVHDDIEDNDSTRYGKQTLHCRHGIPVALNVGDFLMGEGYRWIASVQSHAAEFLGVAVENHRTLCLGQGEELVGLARKTSFTTRETIEIFRRKTAPAFAAALQFGALAAGADRELVSTLQAFSESLGIAYQIRDDLEEYKSGESCNLHASILLALANDQRPMEQLRADDPRLPYLFDELMVVEKAAQLLEHYKNKAIRILNPLQNALLKLLLRQVTAKMLGGG